MLLLSDYLEQRDRRKCLLAREEVYSRASHCFAPGSLVFRKRRPDLYRKVLVLYLKRPRAKSWELRRCGGALQIQRLEGSRPGGLWDLYLDEPLLMVCEFAVGVRGLGFQ